jgi:hypothetical protein
MVSWNKTCLHHAIFPSPFACLALHRQKNLTVHVEQCVALSEYESTQERHDFSRLGVYLTLVFTQSPQPHGVLVRAWRRSKRLANTQCSPLDSLPSLITFLITILCPSQSASAGSVPFAVAVALVDLIRSRHTSIDQAIEGVHQAVRIQARMEFSKVLNHLT